MGTAKTVSVSSEVEVFSLVSEINGVSYWTKRVKANHKYASDIGRGEERYRLKD